MHIREEELIRLAQSGDSEAFCQLAKAYERRVYILALHYCRHRQDAEDLSQEVWLKAYRALAGFRGESQFYTWLRQIIINTFLNYKRGAKSIGEVDSTLNMELSGESDEAGRLMIDERDAMEDNLHKKYLLAEVAKALTELTAQERFIFLLKHREGMTYDEIAEALSCSAGTVKKSLFRAISKLRQHLGVKDGAADFA